MSCYAKPIFYCRPSEPIPEYPETPLPGLGGINFSKDVPKVLENLDTGIATAWSAVRRFCLLVNLCTQTQRLIPMTVIHRTMTSVLYHLLHMSYPAGSLDGIVRVALLAYSYHVFLQWQDITMPGHHFQDAFRRGIQELEGIDEICPRFKLWMLMAGAVSVFDVRTDAWLRRDMQGQTFRCEARSVRQFQDLLKSFMWIPLLDEKRVEAIHSMLGEVGKKVL